MMSWEREEEWIGCIVGGVGTNWGCGRRIVEVYKWFSERVHRGPYRRIALRLGRLDNICLGVWE